MHESDHGLIIYSSGTTDRPKGMLHTNRGPTVQFWNQAQIFGRHEGTRLWSALPIFWTAGYSTAMGPILAAGGCWVMQETFEPGAALELIARERVTEPYTLPHQTAALVEHPNWETADLSSLRSVFGKSAFARHPTRARRHVVADAGRLRALRDQHAVRRSRVERGTRRHEGEHRTADAGQRAAHRRSRHRAHPRAERRRRVRHPRADADGPLREGEPRRLFRCRRLLPHR